MTNARKEFEEHLKGKEVLCAVLKNYDSYWWGDESSKRDWILVVGFNSDQYESFLQSINFEYDSGYGGQELFGVIWYTDGSWSSRGEYDGSEWWEHNRLPEIPKGLKGE